MNSSRKVSKVVANSNGTADVLVSRGFFESARTGESLYADMVKFGLSAGGTSLATLGAHKATHIVESIIAFNTAPTNMAAKQMLKTQAIGKQVVTRAVADYNKTTVGEVTNEMLASFVARYSDEVSVSVKNSIREAPCEAAQDLDANGVNAHPMSKCLIFAVKEVYSERTGKRS